MADFAIYISVGIAFWGMVAFLALHTPESPIDIKWISLAVMTFITFGYPIRWYRRFWGQGRFWGAIVVLLSFHLVGFTFLLTWISIFAICLITS